MFRSVSSVFARSRRAGAVTGLVAALAVLIVGTGASGCDDPGKTAEEHAGAVCELVAPVVEIISTRLRAGQTITTQIVTVATGIVLTEVCDALIEHLNERSDQEEPVKIETGKGTEDLKVSGKNFPDKVDGMCRSTGGCTGYDRCPDSYVCLFTGKSGADKMSLFREGSPDLSGQHIDAAAVSVLNRTGKPVTLYDRHGYDGGTYRIDKGAKTDLPSDWQSRARSIKVGATATATTTTAPPTHSTTPPSSTPPSSTPPSSTSSTSSTSGAARSTTR